MSEIPPLPPQSSNRLTKQKGRFSRASASIVIDCKKLGLAKQYNKSLSSTKVFSDLPPVPVIKTSNVELHLSPTVKKNRRASDSIATFVRPRPNYRIADEVNASPQFLERVRKTINSINKEKDLRRRSVDIEEKIEVPKPKIYDYTVYNANGLPVDC